MKAARRRLAEAEVAEMLERLEGVPVRDMSEVYALLAKLVGRQEAMVEVLAERVAALGEWSSLDVFGRDEARAEVTLYRQLLDSLTRNLLALGKLDIDERMARLREHQIDAIVATVEEGINDAEAALTPSQREMVRARIRMGLAKRGGVTELEAHSR